MGVALGRKGIRAAVLHQHNGGWHITRVQEMPVSLSLFEGEPPPDAIQVLAQALASLLPETVGNFVPLHLALPGASVSLRVLTLDAVPKTESDRISLVRWRLAQELAVGYELACSYQVLEQGKNGGALLGIAVDARWLVCLTEACRIAQIVPTVIDAGFSSLFNLSYSQIATFSGDSVLICLEAESWSMLAIDGQTRIKFARSWWRTPIAASAGGSDYQALALEAEQAIRAYIHGGSAPVERVYLAGDESDIKPLAAVLDQRMQQRCHALAVTAQKIPNNVRSPSGNFSTALAATFDLR